MRRVGGTDQARIYDHSDNLFGHVGRSGRQSSPGRKRSDVYREAANAIDAKLLAHTSRRADPETGWRATAKALNSDGVPPKWAAAFCAVPAERCATKLRTERRGSAGEPVEPSAAATLLKFGIPRSRAAWTHSAASAHRGSYHGGFAFAYFVRSRGRTSRGSLTRPGKIEPWDVRAPDADAIISSRQYRAHMSWSRMMAASIAPSCSAQQDGYIDPWLPSIRSKVAIL